ncbi:hypothetical protein PIB30_104066 [Stylosanthes scabra]|uniref:Uncharacterized protein n=1 Tax=Stylosanthes scabra TaxID=79078 RepID=A0ABU6SZD4_9FABA|nr:hypothetical protein [Stylosanthes scabra]
MARTKQTGKRTRVDPDAPPPPPRLSQMPVESWFEEDDQRTAYQERFSRMEILVPKHLATDVLPEAEFQEFWRLIDVQGLRQFISLRECAGTTRVFVAAAYTTISIFDTLRADGTGNFQFCFKLGGREYILTLHHLANIWGLQNEGATFKSGNNPHGTWDEFDKLEAARFLNLGPAVSGKYQDEHNPPPPVIHGFLCIASSQDEPRDGYRRGSPRHLGHGTGKTDQLAISHSP